jgi:Tfp pilus assembly protein PilP
MKKLLLSVVVISACTALQAQDLKGILSKSTSEATTQVTAPGLLKKSPKTSLSPEEYVPG